MAEIKFPCPQCKRIIQCDVSYVGSQIDCPACQKPISVPAAPPSVLPAGERVIQIKVSTLRKAAMIGLGVLLFLGLVGLAVYLFGGANIVRFKAYVDGADVVKLSGSKVWIEHQSWQLPSKMTINGTTWEPSWNGSTSMTGDLSPAFKPSDPKNIKLTKSLGRGKISIVQMPTSENNETIGIQLDDGDYGGADWYEFTISW